MLVVDKWKCKNGELLATEVEEMKGEVCLISLNHYLIVKRCSLSREEANWVRAGTEAQDERPG
jgi:hypothetical protein